MSYKVKIIKWNPKERPTDHSAVFEVVEVDLRLLNNLSGVIWWIQTDQKWEEVESRFISSCTQKNRRVMVVFSKKDKFQLPAWMLYVDSSDTDPILLDWTENLDFSKGYINGAAAMIRGENVRTLNQVAAYIARRPDRNRPFSVPLNQHHYKRDSQHYWWFMLLCSKPFRSVYEVNGGPQPVIEHPRRNLSQTPKEQCYLDRALLAKNGLHVEDLLKSRTFQDILYTGDYDNQLKEQEDIDIKTQEDEHYFKEEVIYEEETEEKEEEEFVIEETEEEEEEEEVVYDKWNSFSRGPNKDEHITKRKSIISKKLENWGLGFENEKGIKMFQIDEKQEALEEEFVRREMKTKIQQLEDEFAERQAYFRRDYILRIQLSCINPTVWRIFKVSGGITLRALQDKILCPIMGWKRNYHGYQFTDRRDGALFAAIEPQRGGEDVEFSEPHMFLIPTIHAIRQRSVDSAKVNGLAKHKFLPDHTIKLAQILHNKGDEMGYVMDFGHLWLHDIVVEDILSAEESNGAVKLLVGGMNSVAHQDNYHDKEWEELLIKWPKMSKKDRAKYYFENQQYATYGDRDLDPTVFQIDSFKREVRKALHSRASLIGGESVVVLSMAGIPHAPATDLGKHSTYCGYSHSGACYSEYRSTRIKDKRQIALCAFCGNPNDLKTCSKCHAIWYCSKHCAKQDLKLNNHKKRCIPVNS